MCGTYSNLESIRLLQDFGVAARIAYVRVWAGFIMLWREV
jgi:hypothetical protein